MNPTPSKTQAALSILIGFAITGGMVGFLAVLILLGWLKPTESDN
tara:strand:+ start:301 stop:435 length:135 start_codon:yes stop_codon:yes gene_type:complete